MVVRPERPGAEQPHRHHAQRRGVNLREAAGLAEPSPHVDRAAQDDRVVSVERRDLLERHAPRPRGRVRSEPVAIAPAISRVPWWRLAAVTRTLMSTPSECSGQSVPFLRRATRAAWLRTRAGARPATPRRHRARSARRRSPPSARRSRQAAARARARPVALRRRSAARAPAPGLRAGRRPAATAGRWRDTEPGSGRRSSPAATTAPARLRPTPLGAVSAAGAASIATVASCGNRCGSARR